MRRTRVQRGALRGAAHASQPLAQVKLSLLDKLRDRPNGNYGAHGGGGPLQRPGRAEP